MSGVAKEPRAAEWEDLQEEEGSRGEQGGREDAASRFTQPPLAGAESVIVPSFDNLLT